MKKSIIISMAAAVAALGTHAHDEAALAALADMAGTYPNNIITMRPDFGPCA